MPRIMSVCKCLPTVCTLAIIAALTCVTVWDVCLITDEYLHDNQVTFVKWVPVNRSFPFLDNNFFIICLSYGKNTIFPEYWVRWLASLPTNVGKDPVFLRNVSAFLKDYVVDNMKTDSNFSTLEHRRNAAYLLDGIKEMDTNMIEVLKSTQPSNWSDYTFFDDFIGNKSLIDDLESAVWRDLIKNVIYQYFKYPATGRPLAHIRLNALATDYVCVDVNIADLLTRTQHSANFLFSLVNPDEENPKKPFAPLITFQTREYTSQIQLQFNQSTDLSLYITNVGVLDRTDTPIPCQNEPTFTFYNDRSLPCKPPRAIETLFDVCRCLPFTWRREFALVNPALAAQFEYCTSSRYKMCRQELIAKIQDVRNIKQCPPLCTEAKNQYSIVSGNHPDSYRLCNTDIDPKAKEKLCSKANLLIDIPDDVCVVYKERVQITTTQYIGQVGGDIGLYTGLSILGVWQCLVVLYQFLNKHHPWNADPISSTTPSMFRKISTTFGAVFKGLHGAIGFHPPSENISQDAADKKILEILEMIGNLERRICVGCSGNQANNIGNIGTLDKLISAPQAAIQRPPGCIEEETTDQPKSNPIESREHAETAKKMKTIEFRVNFVLKRIECQTAELARIGKVIEKLAQ